MVIYIDLDLDLEIVWWEGGGGVWEQDLPTSTKFGWLKQPKLVVEMVEMGWEEREGRDKSGDGKVRGVGGAGRTY